jgi:hypothetical protein
MAACFAGGISAAQRLTTWGVLAEEAKEIPLPHAARVQ